MKIDDTFPETIQEFAKDLVKICNKHSLAKFNGKFDINTFYKKDCDSWGTINFDWNTGRHGVDSSKILLRTEKFMRMELNYKGEKC